LGCSLADKDAQGGGCIVPVQQAALAATAAATAAVVKMEGRIENT